MDSGLILDFHTQFEMLSLEESLIDQVLNEVDIFPLFDDDDPIITA